MNQRQNLIMHIVSRINFKILLPGLLLLAPYISKSQSASWSIQQCINEALQKNVQLNITRRTNDINQVNLTLARSAQYPSLNGNANQGLSFGKSLNPVTYQYVNQSVNTNAFSLTSSMVLFEGYQLVNTIKMDKTLYEAGKMDIETYKNTIILGVASSYLQLLLDNQLIKIAQSAIETDKKQIEITKVMVTAGSVPELNLYQVQSQLAADQLTLTTNQNQLALDRLTLEQLMDRPDSAGFDIDKPVLADPPAHIDSVPSSTIYNQSVEKQPQVKSTEMKLSGANMQIDIAKGAVYPRLTLNGNISTNFSSTRDPLSTPYYTYENGTIGYLQSNPNALVDGPIPQLNYNNVNNPFFKQLGNNIGEGFTFSLVVPIFNNYVIRGNVEQAVINRDVAQLNDKYTREQYRKTIEQSYTDYYGGSKQFASAMEALRTETESYNVIQVKYKGGASNASDLVLEQNKYVAAQAQVAQAKYNYIFKQKVLEFYEGKAITLQ